MPNIAGKRNSFFSSWKWWARFCRQGFFFTHRPPLVGKPSFFAYICVRHEYIDFWNLTPSPTALIMSDSLMTLLRISIPDHPMLSDKNRYLINGLINGLKAEPVLGWWFSVSVWEGLRDCDRPSPWRHFVEPRKKQTSSFSHLRILFLYHSVCRPHRYSTIMISIP